MEIVRKDLTNFTAEAWLIKRAENESIRRGDGEIVDSKYFAVSGCHSMGDSEETMIFSCDENGKVSDWREVAVVQRIDHQEAIDALNIEIQES